MYTKFCMLEDRRGLGARKRTIKERKGEGKERKLGLGDRRGKRKG